MVQDKFVSLFKTNRPKKAVYGRGKKLRKPKKQNIRCSFILKEKIIRDIWTLFESEEEKKERKKLEKKNNLMKD